LIRRTRYSRRVSSFALLIAIYATVKVPRANSPAADHKQPLVTADPSTHPTTGLSLPLKQ
jgi:hypothetical protein